MSKLTLKQQRFADEYIICGNATEAAIKAGYSERTARSQGNRLLTNVDIDEYIKNRLVEIQDEKILTQQQVLILLSEIASGLIPEVQVVTVSKPVMIEDESTGKKIKAYEDVPEQINLPTKNSDRNKALELLGKRYRLWTDKVEAEIQGTVVFANEADIPD
ncbi:TPA: terminase small subunit [Streptococcus suis]|nr:terminase small subunit [Streptococcus suis]